jgi:hypothetical protein
MTLCYQQAIVLADAADRNDPRLHPAATSGLWGGPAFSSSVLLLLDRLPASAALFVAS